MFQSSLQIVKPIFSIKDVVYLDRSCVGLVKKLANEKTKELFGDKDWEEVVNLSGCIVGISEHDNDNIVGIMCLNRYPNIPALPPWDWYDWFQYFYGVENVNSRNALFVHLFVYDERYGPLLMNPMARILFRRDALDYIFLVVPPGILQIDFIDHMATRVLPKGYMNPRTVQSLYMLAKPNFIKKYKIRRAVEEDNDDVVPLIEIYSKKMKEYYGEFYIAELLTRHADCGRQLVVAEYEGVAIAVICLNEHVNYEVLNEGFELAPYHGLKKPLEADVTMELSTVELPEEFCNIFSSALDAISTIEETTSSESCSERTPSISSDFSLVLSVGSYDNDYSSEDKVDVIPNLAEYKEHLTRDHLRYEHHKEALLNSEAKTSQYLNLIENTKIPSYFGEPNAFAVEISLAHPKHFSVISQLYEAAFECFPDREYCILSHPYTLTAPLLHAFMFIPPRPMGQFANALYIQHRNAVIGHIEIRKASPEDRVGVKKLLRSLKRGQFVLERYEETMESPCKPRHSYVMACDDQIVGLAILQEEHDVEYLTSHYKLETWFEPKHHRAGSHGLIEDLLVCPIFSHSSRFFLTELHRLSDFSILYHKLNPIETTVQKDKHYLNALNYMIPIPNRTMPYFHMDYLQDYPPSKIITKKAESYALYMSIENVLGQKNREFNTRIVVVGISDVGLGFLEALFMRSPNEKSIVFHNVTLVVPHSLNRHKIPAKIRDYLFIQTGFDRDNFMDTFSPMTFVNVVYGLMTAINRKERYIVIDNISFLPYDLLFLFCGEQFQRNSVRPDVQPKIERPENVYIINSEIDGMDAFDNLKATKLKRGAHKIIVYGHFLEAHCCLATLLAFGIPPDHLVYIEPFPHNASFDAVFRHNVAFYNDPEVDEAVLETIQKMGIKYYQGYYFHDWVYDPEENIITHAKFESEYQYLQVKCWAMFFYIGKSVSPKTFNSIIEAGLVFDGRLIIDAKCRTNDPKIYGAGTLTRYGRHYDAEHLSHNHFNKKEIGATLGKKVKTEILELVAMDDYYQPQKEIAEVAQKTYLVPIYKEPIVVYCRLPGGLYYLSIRSPGVRIPMEAALSRSDYGSVLITGNCKNLNKQGYFRLHLNRFNKVETITCLTKFPIEVNNLKALYGKHEMLLNKLRTRFEMVLIKDLFEFFREPWAYAIYYDKFTDFWADLDEFILTIKANDGEKFVDKLKDKYHENKWKKLSQWETDELQEMYYESEDHKILEQMVVQFLEKNSVHLPMYYTKTIMERLQDE